MFAVLDIWLSLMSPNTITGLSLPRIKPVRRKRSADASAVRRMVDSAAPRLVWCGRYTSRCALNQGSRNTLVGPFDLKWQTKTCTGC